MIYQGFAYIYDQLMKDAPYELWVNIIEESISLYHPGASTLLDIGCGTGEIAVLLADKQLSVTGVDLSEDMLAVAQSKAEKNKANILFLQQDMRHLTDFPTPFDVITICCDSLNYLETELDVQATFEAVYSQLQNEGLFIFDVHSLHKIYNVFANAAFTDQDEEVSFIWNSFLGDEPNSIEHDMTFFVKRDEYYERYDELHYQRTFSIEQYSLWLKEASFEIVNICGDFELNKEPNDMTERVFFICKKR